MSDLPAGWVVAKLDSIVDYVTSGSRDWSKFYSNAGALFVRTQDINTNRLTSLENIARVKLPEKIEGKRTLIRLGDILITITGANVGKCARISDPIPEAYVSQSVALVRLLEPSIGPFIHLQLIAPGEEGDKTLLQQSAYGMGRPVLSLPIVRDVRLRIAPTKEQSRIVEKLTAVLDKVDRCRERLDRVPQILKKFREAVLEAAVSGRLTEEWRVERNVTFPPSEVLLESVWRDASYGTAAKSSGAGSVPVLRMGNIQNGRLDWTDLVYTSGASEISKYALSDGDVLFNRTNSPELVGKTAVYHAERQAIFAGYLLRVRCGRALLPDYLGHCLNSPAGRRYCWSVKTDGVSQSNINAKKLGRFPLHLPTIAEQTEIVRRVAETFAFLEELERRYRETISRVSRLTPAILTKAFRGELVPQDPNDEPASELLARSRSHKETTMIVRKKKTRPILSAGKPRKSESAPMTPPEPSQSLVSLFGRRSRLEPAALLQASRLDLDQFYDQLKADIAAGLIRERRSGKGAEKRWLELVR